MDQRTQLSDRQAHGDHGGYLLPQSPPFPDVYRALQAITDAETGVQDKSKIALQISFGTAGFQVDENGTSSPPPSTIPPRIPLPSACSSPTRW